MYFNTRKIRLKTFLNLLLLITSSVTIAQQIDSAMFFNPLVDDITKKILPLEALIDSAIANEPLIKLEDLEIAYARYDIKSARRDWTKNFGFDADLHYGTYWYNDRDELTQLGRFYLNESRRTNYWFGIYVKFPIFYIIDRKNEINKKKKLVEVSMVRKQERIRQIRELVITTYNELVQQQNLLIIANDFRQFSMVQMQMAELQYLNREIDIADYTRLKDYQTRGDLNFAEILGRFNIAYTLLEEIVGIKFNLVNVLK